MATERSKPTVIACKEETQKEISDVICVSQDIALHYVLSPRL